MSIDNPIVINNGAYRDSGRVMDSADLDFDGVVPITEYATEHQISVRLGDATTGTVALTGVPLGSDTETVITDETGAAIVFDLADLVTLSVVRVFGVWEQFVLTPTGEDGTFIVDTTGWI